MTQYQQVLAAIKKLNGKGTTDEIYQAIDGIANWKTQTKKASVASYLSTSDVIKKDGDFWVYDDSLIKTNDKKQSVDKTERGLYFITLNPGVKPPVPGLLFKIGLTDGKASNRLISYSAGLPYNTIQELGFFRIPQDVDLRSAEEQVRGELLGNDDLGFHIERFFGNHQVEWLQTLDLSLNEEDINKLAKVVNKIIKDTIIDLQENTN